MDVAKIKEEPDENNSRALHSTRCSLQRFDAVRISSAVNSGGQRSVTGRDVAGQEDSRSSSEPTSVSSAVNGSAVTPGQVASRNNSTVSPPNSVAGATIVTAAVSCANFAASSATNGRHSAGGSPPQLICVSATNCSVASNLATPVAAAAPAPSTIAPHVRKVRRFFAALAQPGGADGVGDESVGRVKSLVLALVGGCISIEEFLLSLQEISSCPLRPSVVPFLRVNVPVLQREVLALARAAKLTLAQYLRQNEHVVFEPHSSNQELSPTDVFNSEAHDLRKRTLSEGCIENGSEPRLSPTVKRTRNAAFLCSPPASNAAARVTSPMTGHVTRDVTATRTDDSAGGERDEWKNIHVMLNCILSMVEKTRRALAILQQRSPRATAGAPPPTTTEINWSTAPHHAHQIHESHPLETHRHSADLLARTVRATEQRIAEIRRRAVDAVCEVKRQAVRDLQRAVSEAECRASELMTGEERSRFEPLISTATHDTRKYAAASAATVEENYPLGRQMVVPENCCWNCGRGASDTCSGCGVARYCGAFCQLRDWQRHRTRCQHTGATTAHAPPDRLSPDDR